MHAAPVLPSDMFSDNALAANGESTTDGQFSTTFRKAKSKKKFQKTFTKGKRRSKKEEEESTETVASPTPLDRYFSSYAPFPYNSGLSPDESYRALSKYFGWKGKRADRDEAWEGYSRAMYEETRMLFGSENDINAWHHLCRAIGVKDPPATFGVGRDKPVLP
ncbi:hypothetical protein CMQ_5675 [Grosmannia clavigera kw1407]|uniref:Uncharacterized protein n=1 Tax=Grosmannia clavigera (strain kw1407 / UAMH 11150) TaxID=655863 RepID=F0XTC6_GROCL|nr:uncharacterized protein CMQ_5675 [Grosmannia clavigera kw1407]EFW99254.1 hypothetical protein CMQ_5675 [Grosmannia clavigera kw1407]